MPFDAVGETLRNHAIICGCGRIGQSVGHLLEKEQMPYVALDLDPSRVREARIGGEHVYYGASQGLAHVRALRPELPVMVRTHERRASRGVGHGVTAHARAPGSVGRRQ